MFLADMASPGPVDIGAALNAIAAWFNTFLTTLTEYAPVIMAVSVLGYLVVRYSRTIRQTISQLLAFF